MVDRAGNPLVTNPWGVPVTGTPATFNPAVQLPVAGQPPVAVPPPVAIPPQAWSPDATQFSPQAIQAAGAPQTQVATQAQVTTQAQVVPASNPQGYTTLWAETPETSLWEARWRTAPSVSTQPPPVVPPAPVYTPPVVLAPLPVPPPPPVAIPPVAAPPVPTPPVPVPAEPPKPDHSPAPIGGLPTVPEPAAPPTHTASRLGGLPGIPEPEPEPAPEPVAPTHTAARLGGLPGMPEPEPPPKPTPKPEGVGGRSWKVVADPHVTTGDGKLFDASLAGRFTLLRSSDGKFEVQNTQGKIPGDNGIWNTAISIKCHADTIAYDAPSQILTLNDKKIAFKAGSKLTLPSGGRLEMTNSEYAPGKFASRIQVVTPEGDRTAWLILQRKNGGRYLDLYGNIGAKRQAGEMSGMAGAFDADANPENDLKLRSGKIAPNLDAFLKDWKTP